MKRASKASQSSQNLADNNRATWEPKRFGADPPDSLVELVKAGYSGSLCSLRRESGSIRRFDGNGWKRSLSSIPPQHLSAARKGAGRARAFQSLEKRSPFTYHNNSCYYEYDPASPSMLKKSSFWNEGLQVDTPIVCHSFLEKGVWRFLGDCTHEHAGEKMPEKRAV